VRVFGFKNIQLKDVMKKLTAFLPVFALIGFISCEKEDGDSSPDLNYNPVIIPVNFTDSVTNTFFPLTEGKIYTYVGESEEGTETVIITVSPVKRVVAGVSCTVVRDVVTLEGVMLEDTYDWYAQDTEGNVWYFGEDVSNYENGEFQDKDGSFEAGILGAKPGIIMLASPVLELPYRQEYSFGVAEDWGKVVAKGLTVTTTYGTFNDCIKTADWNALEPEAPLEYKYYAPGVGLVKEEVEGSGEVLELVSIELLE
jgi:hypothetical protein